ncbi:cbb3-type cytochrome c oxidase subunit 3 [Parapedomonas caeni]|jgi:cytochrome c oxidase cbb3-type subunit 4
MTYEALQRIAGMGGMALFIALFIGVLIYALRPSNRAKFDAAARVPLARDEGE